MILLKNIIAPIVSDCDTNMYVVGLCLKHGQIIKIKIYNKIFDYNKNNDSLIINFAGDYCYNYYKNTKEWKKLYPGFSGFTIGIECSVYNNNIKNINYGYGFKDISEGKLIFNAYYIDFFKKIYKNEIYDYVEACNLMNFNNKLNTKYIEIKRNNHQSYCYCPKINLQNTKNLENLIFNALETTNNGFINRIKQISNNFSIVNYGISEDYEKIYIISKNKNNVQEIIYLINSLEIF